MLCGCIDCFLLYNEMLDQGEKGDPRMELQGVFAGSQAGTGPAN